EPAPCGSPSSSLGPLAAGFGQFGRKTLHFDELINALLRRQLQVPLQQSHVDVALERFDQRITIVVTLIHTNRIPHRNPTRPFQASAFEACFAAAAARSSSSARSRAFCVSAAARSNSRRASS